MKVFFIMKNECFIFCIELERNEVVKHYYKTVLVFRPKSFKSKKSIMKKLAFEFAVIVNSNF